MNDINFDGVYITDIYEYKRKSNIIKNLINSSFSNLDIKYTQANDKDIVRVQINNDLKFGIFPDHSWKEIKNIIEHKLNPAHNNTICNICDDYIIFDASCPRCQTEICLECYILNYKNGLGVVKCVFCYYTYGVHIPKKYINFLIDNIRENAYKQLK